MNHSLVDNSSSENVLDENKELKPSLYLTNALSPELVKSLGKTPDLSRKLPSYDETPDLARNVSALHGRYDLRTDRDMFINDELFFRRDDASLLAAAGKERSVGPTAILSSAQHQLQLCPSKVTHDHCNALSFECLPSEARLAGDGAAVFASTGKPIVHSVFQTRKSRGGRSAIGWQAGAAACQWTLWIIRCGKRE